MTRKRKNTFHNKTLHEYINHFHQNIGEDAEIGIEVEVEGANLPRTGIRGWEVHEDGSLRGESCEYVFRGPATRKDSPVRLRALRSALSADGVAVNESYRTSVHVHLNARPLTIKSIYTWIMLYTIFEDALAEIAGKDRKGNLFCLRAKDAEYYIDRLLLACRDDDLSVLNDQNLRYSAANPVALFRHGTLEFRSFRGTVDINLIQQWAELLLAIKDGAQLFENPIQLMRNFAEIGPDELAAKIFSKDQINLFPAGWQDGAVESINLLQHVAHANDWKMESETKKDEPQYASYVSTEAIVGVAGRFDELDHLERVRVRHLPENLGVRINMDDDL